MRPELEALREALAGKKAKKKRPRPEHPGVRVAKRREFAAKVMLDYPEDAERIREEILGEQDPPTEETRCSSLPGAARHAANGTKMCRACTNVLTRSIGSRLLREKGLNLPLQPAEVEVEERPAPPPRDPEVPWREQAACRDAWRDEELREAIFAYGEKKGDIVAQILCHGACPVIEECRNFARKTKVNHGVWGGYWLRDMTITAAEKRGARR